MSKKSEEFANNAYPNYSPDGKTQVDMSAYRFACAKGYEQAEKSYAKLKELADNMYSAAQYLTTDASRLRKAMEEYHNYIVYEVKL